jgi:hypothetical protein
VRSAAGRVLARAAPARAALRRFLARERTRKVLQTGALAALGIIVLLGLAFFAFRNAALRGILDAKLRSFAKDSPGTVIEVGAARFHGLAGVELEKVRLRSAEGIAVDLGRCVVTASFWRLLVGQVRLKSLALDDLRLDLGVEAAPALKAAGQANPRETGKKAAAAGTARPPDYGARIARLLDIYFTRVPDLLVIDRLTIHSAFDGVRQALYIPRLALGGPAFATTLDMFDQGMKWSCAMSGGVERGRKRLELRLEPVRSGPATLRRGDADGPRRGGARPAMPFLVRQWGLKVDFVSLSVSLQSRGRKDGVLRLDGSLAIAGLALNHPRIAAGDVDLDSAALDFSLGIGADFVELARPSRVSFNRMSFQPQARLRVRPSRQVLLKIPETRFAADDLFASLPAGLFTRLAGIRTSGELSFHLDFAIDLSRPEAVVLDVGLERHDFRILRFGNANLRSFVGPFLYTAYEKDRPVRSFVVGPENPSFRFLESIPPFLQYSVMISEDGAFFSHKGFLLEPFKNSIVTNLRAGRFVRGASTISMQLVKNLYLRRHKTIARKLEELLITWLIEENRLVSKGRMLETYLNIIEWGPGVYGAEEAARFYFAKDVEELTLAESIFMAAVIPRPKRFMGFFGDDQRLRPWLERYYADVSEKMLARGWISQFDYDTLIPAVELRGPALLLLKSAEAVPLEPLGIPEEE